MAITDSLSYGEDIELFNFVKELAKEFNGNRSSAYKHMIESYRKQKNENSRQNLVEKLDFINSEIVNFLQVCQFEDIVRIRASAYQIRRFAEYYGTCTSALRKNTRIDLDWIASFYDKEFTEIKLTPEEKKQFIYQGDLTRKFQCQKCKKMVPQDIIMNSEHNCNDDIVEDGET